MPEWYYEFEGRQAGPVPTEAILSLRQSGVISDSTRVWREGMDDWIAAGLVPELAPSSGIANPTPIAAPQPIATPPTATELNYFNPAGNQVVAYAGFWLRFVAYLIDIILLRIVAFGIVFAAQAAMHMPGVVPTRNLIFVSYRTLPGMTELLIDLLYFSLMESSAHQATLGKMAMGIIVTDLQGQRIS